MLNAQHWSITTLNTECTTQPVTVPVNNNVLLSCRNHMLDLSNTSNTGAAKRLHCVSGHPHSIWLCHNSNVTVGYSIILVTHQKRTVSLTYSNLLLCMKESCVHCLGDALGTFTEGFICGFGYIYSKLRLSLCLGTIPGAEQKTDIFLWNKGLHTPLDFYFL